MYYASKKKSFTHFECCEVVKDHPSFTVVLSTTPPTYATPSSNEESPTVNLEDDQVDDIPLSNDGASQIPPRPMGNKAAKERRRLMKQGKTPVQQRVKML